MKISIKRIKPYVYLAIFASFGVAFYFSYTFLNESFYQAMSQSREILDLQKNLTVDTIDMEKFEQVLKKIDEKTSAPAEISDLKNPFD